MRLSRIRSVSGKFLYAPLRPPDAVQNITKTNIAANIAAAIEKARTKRAERAELTADWVIDDRRGDVSFCYILAADDARISGRENLTRDARRSLVNFGFRPSLTPRALARARPSPVRVWIKSLSGRRSLSLNWL